MDILKVGEWNTSVLIGLGLSSGQKFQESLAKNLLDTEDDQYLGRQGVCSMNGASGLQY